MKGLWRHCRLGSLPALRTSLARSYSELPVPVTTLTDDEKMMKETGELRITLARLVGTDTIFHDSF